MSLNASVGPFDTCSRWTPGSSCVTGAIASVPNVAFVYVRSMSALRSASGISVMQRRQERVRESGIGKAAQRALFGAVKRG